jgi:hypothetical protein
VARDPVVAILLLAGIFDGLSGNPIHAILLIGVAVALARDAVVGFGGEPAGADVGRPALHLRRWATAALLAGAAIYAALLGRFPRYSWLVTAGVVVPGTLVLVLAWPGRVGRRPEASKLDPLGVLAWLAVFVGLALWELTNLLLQPSLTTDSYAHPTLSVLSDPFLASAAGRAIGLFVWLVLGWFLVDR